MFSVPTPVTIVKVENEDTDSPDYTIKFSSGFQMMTKRTQLSLTKVMPDVKVAERFKHVKQPVTPIKSATLRVNPYLKQASRVKLRNEQEEHEDDSIDSSILEMSKEEFVKDEALKTGPTASQINQFQRFFMAKLESSEQILTFYQQLQAQGAAYGLMCIELQSITPDIDLCHPGSTSVARRKMMIAIYQKLQDVECVSETYVEARNFVSRR